MNSIRYGVILCLMAGNCLLSAQYTLTLRCSSMTAYLGRSFHIRVIETGSEDEVGRKTIPSIGEDTLNIQLTVLLGGKDYKVDFYVDNNQNMMYDNPPTDHAWRRIVSGISGPQTIDFVPFVDYTDISFPDITRGYYDAIWGGRWMNQTIGTTDSLESTYQIACDSLLFSFTTAGIFGNPATVSIDFAEARQAYFNPVTDTLHFTINPPWTGEAYLINSELHGNLSMMNLGIALNGTAGHKQILSLYTVTDGGSPVANGYFYSKELQVLQEFLPLELEMGGSSVSCHGGSDGSVWVTVGGGTGNYEYNWLETGTATFFIDGVWADTFTVVVTDDLGCSAEGSYIVEEHHPVLIDDIIIVPASCSGACDALITITASGGTEPYAYEVIADSCTGFATVFVTDALGCEDSTSIFITSISNLGVFGLSVTPASDGQPNGEVEIEVDEGIPPYFYSLDGISFQASPVFTGLAPGTYSITIMDSNGCITESNSFVIENTTGIPDISARLRIYPNPASTNLRIDSDQTVSFDLMDLDGHILKHGSPSGNHMITVSDLPRGLYFMRVRDGRGYSFQKVILN